jgi:hypothetical protein
VALTEEEDSSIAGEKAKKSSSGTKEMPRTTKINRAKGGTKMTQGAQTGSGGSKRQTKRQQEREAQKLLELQVKQEQAEQQTAAELASYSGSGLGGSASAVLSTKKKKSTAAAQAVVLPLLGGWRKWDTVEEGVRQVAKQGKGQKRSGI